MGFDHHIVLDHCVMAEKDGFGRDQGHPLHHRAVSGTGLKRRFSVGEVHARVHAQHLIRIRLHRFCGQAASARQPHKIGEIIFAAGVLIGHLAQQLEHEFGGHGQNAGIAQADLQLVRAGVLGLDNRLKPALGVLDQTAIAARRVRLEAQNGNCRALSKRVKHALNGFGLDQRRIGVEHDHIALKAGQRALRLLHGMTGALGRVLHSGLRACRLSLIFDLRRMRAPDHHFPVRLHRVRQRQRPVEHGAARNRVERLGHRRFHTLAMAGGEDDCGAGARGHEPGSVVRNLQRFSRLSAIAYQDRRRDRTDASHSLMPLKPNVRAHAYQSERRPDRL